MVRKKNRNNVKDKVVVQTVVTPQKRSQTQSNVNMVTKQVAEKVVKDVLSKNASNTKAQKVQDMKKLDKCLASLAAPSVAPTVRMNNGFSSYKSATTKLFHRKDATFYAPTGTMDTDAPAFVFRDQCRAFVYRTSYSDLWRYKTSFAVSFDFDFSPVLVPALDFDNTVVTTQRNAVHGELMFPGVESRGRRSYFWMENDNQMRIVNNTTGEIEVSIFIWNRGFASVAGGTVQIAPTTTYTFQPISNAYYGFDAKSVSTAIAVGQLDISVESRNSTGKVWAHLPLPFAEKNLASVDSAKIYGVSIMYTNRAAPIYRQGDIASVQIPNGRFWTDYLDYRSIASLNDADSRSVENGVYGFLKPTMPNDLNFKDQDRFDISMSDVDSFFLLNPDSDFLAVCAHIKVADGQDGYWTAGYALEYRTTDQWREQKAPDVNVEVTNAAIQLLSRLPQWHDNPLHLSDIGNWIKDRANDAYGFIKDILPGVVSVGTTAAKIAGAIIPLL